MDEREATGAVVSPSPKRDYSQLLKDALVELKHLRASLDEVHRARHEAIAIIGAGCRLPGGVDTPEAFWRLLHEGVDAITLVPPERWEPAAYYDPDPLTPGKMSTSFGGFVEKIDEFDPVFFGISPREAQSLDPQQRLLLEVSWEAIERSGQSPAQLYGSSTGVFIGMSTFDYALHQIGGSVGQADLDRIDGYVATGTTLSPAAGRLSYVLGLTGPSMVVDTACSSSLVAAHLAISSLRARECDMALVGGVNLILRPEWNINFSKAGMMAPDGRCKTFDASADGYVRGEGAAVLLLQRVSDAVAQGRPIMALLRGSAVNQDGASGGLTVPNGPAQERVIRRALEAAGVEPLDVGYVEAHGTGTSLGDPIEVAALGAVFGPGRSKAQPLRIGSVKTNIGHLEAAAGVAGLLKVALALRHGEIPPHLHFARPNPLIDWDSLPIAVPVGPTPWPASDRPRRAGISSFGFTGTNSHLVLEEAPRAAAPADSSPSGPKGPADPPVHVLTASGRTAEALREQAARYARYLTEEPHLHLKDVAYTANAGRSHFRHRLAVVADSLAAAQAGLAAHASGLTQPGTVLGHAADRPKLVFLFTGQGSQYVGMGRQLYETQSAFRAVIDRSNELLRPQREASLLEVLYSRNPSSLLDRTAYTQPALFAVECALAEMWRSWGIEPDAVMGHSVGEYAAAYVAGIFSLEDGLGLIAERARLMEALPETGQMVAVQTDEAHVAAVLAAHGPEVSLAAVNGPKSTVISGPFTAVADVVTALEAIGVRTQPLKVSQAFHSVLMEPMLREFERACSRVRFAPPRKTVVSNLTGLVGGNELLTPAYWVRHARAPVRFATGMNTLHSNGGQVFVEIGPSSTLLALGRDSSQEPSAAWLPSLMADRDWHQVARTLAELYARGASVDWAAVDAHPLRRTVDLPTYPFQRQRYWIDVQRPALGLDTKEASPNGAHRRDSARPAAAVDNLLYRVEWVRRPRPNVEADGGVAERWLILTDRGRLGSELARSLRARGARCTMVEAGAGYSVEDADLYRLDPNEPANLARLYAAVSAEAEPPRKVVHLWSLDVTAADGPKQAGQSAFPVLEHALSLVQAIGGAKGGPQNVIWFVTRGAVPFGASPAAPLTLLQAPLWGFGRVAALELPDTWGGMVDLELGGHLDAEAEALARELLTLDGEDQVAIRSDEPYVPRLMRRAKRTESKVMLDEAGTYVVAGGLGALGLHAARWLVSRGARHLILASRRGQETPGAEQAVGELERLGAREVKVVKADISREQDVEQLLALAAAPPRRLRGVIHAAGVDSRVRLADMTAADLRAGLESKVRGAWLLHDKSRAAELNLFVCFSSVSSILGAPERAHYAAANAFLDALAHERHRLGLPALTVNWGPWRDGGMASDDELRRLEQLGNAGLDPALALRALDVLLDGGDVQATVIDADWSRLRQNFEARRARPLLSGLGERLPPIDGQSGASAPDWLETLRGVALDRQRPVLEALVRAEVADVLGFSRPEDVPVDQSVFELGMDSFRAVQLTIRLQRHLGLTSSIQFFDCPQVEALAGRLLAVVMATRTEGATTEKAGDVHGLTGYAPERESEIFQFSRAAWRTRPQQLLEERWRWMFVESAKRLGQEPKLWLFRESGKIVAHHGAIPVRLKAGPSEIDSAWFVDTMVLESHRASATGTQLLVESNTAFPVGLSLGQTTQMRKIALQLGWHQVAPMQTLVMLLRPSRVFKGKLNPVVAGVAAVALNARSYLQRRIAGPGDSGLDVRTVEGFDERHDRLWDSVKTDYDCAVRRDASYLNWKYVTQPGQDFLRLEWRRGGSVCAVAILAMDEPGSIYRYRRALIVDVLLPSSNSSLVRGVLSGIRRHCAALGADAIVFHVINEQLVALARSCGFSARAPMRFLLVNPLDSSPPIREALLSPTRWLVTMGDSDIDRPWDVEGQIVQIRRPRPKGSKV